MHNTAKIMKEAWAKYRAIPAYLRADGFDRATFAICLKMAWAEAKRAKAETSAAVIALNDLMNRDRWSSADYRRVSELRRAA